MALVKRGKNPNWFARFKHRGKPYLLSTGTSVHRDARDWEARKRAALEDAYRAGVVVAKKEKAKGHTLAEVAGLDVQRAIAAGVAADTITSSYEIHWKHISRILGASTSPAAIGEEQITLYVVRRRSEVGGAPKEAKASRQPIRGQTIRKELRTLKRGLGLAHRRGWIASVPANWPALSKDKPDVRKAGKNREPAILDAWLEVLPEDARDEALFAVMTALRSTELKRVRPEWVEPMPKGFPVPAILRLPPEATKGRYERIVGLTEAALAIVQRAQERRANPPKRRGPQAEDDGTLFGPQDRRNAYRRASAKLGIYPTLHLRDLRHTHASRALASGVDLKALMTAMGHKDLEMAARYQHSTLARTAAVATSIEVYQPGCIQKPKRRRK